MLWMWNSLSRSYPTSGDSWKMDTGLHVFAITYRPVLGIIDTDEFFWLQRCRWFGWMLIAPSCCSIYSILLFPMKLHTCVDMYFIKNQIVSIHWLISFHRLGFIPINIFMFSISEPGNIYIEFWWIPNRIYSLYIWLQFINIYKYHIYIQFPSGGDIFCLKNFDTFTRISVCVSKMNAVACAQLTVQMSTLFKKYLYRQRKCTKHGTANVWLW